MKICCICSSGGHLAELKLIMSEVNEKDIYWVTQRTTGMHDEWGDYHIEDTKRSLVSVIRNFYESLFIFNKEQPDIIITTGAGVALNTCIIGRLFHRRVFYFESVCRIEDLSLFGQLMLPIANKNIVQWKSLRRFPNTDYLGNLFDILEHHDSEYEDYIFLTVGKHYMPFNRLLSTIDRAIDTGIISHKIIAQIGNSTYKPRNFESFSFSERERYEYLMQNCRCMISHAGAGVILEGLQLSKPILLVPRLTKYGEHTNDHQLELCHFLEKNVNVEVAYDSDDIIQGVINTYKKPFLISTDHNPELKENIASLLK
jgi:UDP-N-acetylglucosamine transferase subunit ALG13